MRVIFLFALATLIPLVPFLLFLRRRKSSATATDVADTLKAFLDGRLGRVDWNDFVETPIADPALEVVRATCAALPERFPPQERGQWCAAGGLEVVRGLLSQLSGKAGPGAAKDRETGEPGTRFLV
jgi:hypothetical protein